MERSQVGKYIVTTMPCDTPEAARDEYRTIIWGTDDSGRPSHWMYRIAPSQIGEAAARAQHSQTVAFLTLMLKAGQMAKQGKEGK
jgi:hypothetical protein